MEALLAALALEEWAPGGFALKGTLKVTKCQNLEEEEAAKDIPEEVRKAQPRPFQPTEELPEDLTQAMRPFQAHEELPEDLTQATTSQASVMWTEWRFELVEPVGRWSLSAAPCPD